MANEAIDIIITKKAREELIATREEITRTDAEFIKLANNINSFTGKKVFPTLPKEYEARLRESSKWTAQLNANNKEAERLAGALSRQKARVVKLETENAKALAKERLETQILNKALKDETVLSSKLVGAYQKLTVRRNQAAAAIKNEIALNGQNSKSLGKLRAEFDKLDKRYVSANRGARDFRDNVGNYKSALGGATSAFRSFAGAFGIYSGLQIAQQVYGQIKAIDGMNKALQNVTETQGAFNDAQSFLTDTADESGANIIGLTSAYTKFLASAKTTNLTLDDTKNIFRQVSKAAGVLGLDTEATNGAFRALEQILSKGKVQAEEIRGQLGERLPGAFQILAKSMGLTTAELSKQLELGTVISEEVLPGFARELENTYSLDKVERVQTLAAAQNRLGNAWVEFLQNVENGEGTISRVLTGILDAVTAVVDAMAKLVESSESINKKLQTDKAKTALEDLKAVAEQTGQTLRETAADNFFDYTKSVEKARAEVERLKGVQSGISPTISAGRGVNIPNPEYQRNNALLDEANTALAIRQGRLDAVNDILRANTKETKENNKAQEDAAKTGRRPDLTPRLGKVATPSFGSTGSESKKRDKQFKDTFDFSFGADAIEAPDTDEITEALQKIAEEATKAAGTMSSEFEKNSKIMEDVFSGTFSTFEQYYGLDLTSFKKLLAGKEASLDDYADTAKSISNFLLESQLIRYENEIVANEEKLERVLTDENASEKKKAQARLEKEKKEKEIRIKQAKEERKAALIQVAIDTAVGIVKATSLGFPAMIPIIALVAGLGIAQAAIIKSQPLPKFAAGTENAPRGEAITDEEGPELRIGRDGKVKSLGSKKGARVQKLDAGDKIFTAKRTRDIYKNAMISDRQIEQDKIDMMLMRSISAELDLKPLKGMMRKEIREGFSGVRITNINNNNYSQKTTRYRA